jgi:DNA repair ATPase RecN
MGGIAMRIQDKAKEFERSIVVLRTKKETAEDTKKQLIEQRDQIDIDFLKQCNMYLDKFSRQQREKAKSSLEELCTAALQYAISPDLEAQIELSTLRNKPSAQLFVNNKKTGVKTTPISGNGGGVVDTVGTSMRFIMAEVWREPPIDGPMILDEAYKHLSKEYAPPTAEFLKKTSTDFDRQIILSTHNDYIATCADRKVYISLDDNGHSKVRYGDRL